MSEPFVDSTARDAWDYGAEAWREFVRSGADYYRAWVHGPALIEACGVQPRERVLDVGCGEGFFSRELARKGANVTGIDLSPRMLEHARAEEAHAPLGIEYCEGSAVVLERHFVPGQFDLIASCMAIQDMSDSRRFLQNAHVVLAAAGRLVFSVPHPGTDMPTREWERDASGRKLALKVDRYFETGPAECDWNMRRLVYRWRTPFWRRTLEQWSAMIADAGFVIERLFEPRPDGETVARLPELDDCARLPYFLIFRLLKR